MATLGQMRITLVDYLRNLVSFTINTAEVDVVNWAAENTSQADLRDAIADIVSGDIKSYEATANRTDNDIKRASDNTALKYNAWRVILIDNVTGAIETFRIATADQSLGVNTYNEQTGQWVSILPLDTGVGATFKTQMELTARSRAGNAVTVDQVVLVE